MQSVSKNKKNIETFMSITYQINLNTSPQFIVLVRYSLCNRCLNIFSY